MNSQVAPRPSPQPHDWRRRRQWRLAAFLPAALALLLVAVAPTPSFAKKKEIEMSKSDSIRGWSWDGEVASYVAVMGGRSMLYMRYFDGENFGKDRFEPIELSKSDSIRGWHWDGQKAGYITYFGKESVLHYADFDGKSFKKIGPPRTIDSGGIDKFHGWSYFDSVAIYTIHSHKKRKATGNYGLQLVHAAFTASKKTDKIKFLKWDVSKNKTGIKPRGLHVGNRTTSMVYVKKNGRTYLSVDLVDAADLPPVKTRYAAGEVDVQHVANTNTDNSAVFRFKPRRDDILPMKHGRDKLGSISLLGVNPEIAKTDGRIQVFMPCGTSLIDPHYKGTDRPDELIERAWYMKNLKVKLDLAGAGSGWRVRGFPENLNEDTGTYTTSNQTTIGVSVGAGPDGPSVGGGASYSWGSSFSTKVSDFTFENQTSLESRPAAARFDWRLSKTGSPPTQPDETSVPYLNQASLAMWHMGQYSGLRNLPPLARENFPLACEAIFSNDGHSGRIPDKIRARMTIEAEFERVALKFNRQSSEATAVGVLTLGLGLTWNPDVLAGERFYHLQHETKTTKNVIEVDVDLSKVK